MKTTQKTFKDLIEAIDKDEVFKVHVENGIPNGYWVAKVKMINQYRYYVFEGSVFDTESKIIGRLEKQKFYGENWLGFVGSRIHCASAPTVHKNEISGIHSLIQETMVH